MMYNNFMEEPVNKLTAIFSAYIVSSALAKSFICSIFIILLSRKNIIDFILYLEKIHVRWVKEVAQDT